MAPSGMDGLSQSTAETMVTTNGEAYATNLASILEARARIQPFVRTTPVLTSSTLNALAGRNLFFKCENFQRGGAFKLRGACNAIFSLPEHEARRGVVTHSSGNHGAAVALAAKLRGIPAHVVLPYNTPACKRANVERYGGQIVLCEPTILARQQVCKDVQGKTGGVLVHPFNDGHVMSGQGTLAVELLEQVPELDAIFCPISGGGLISGVSVAAKALKPTIKIFAAEPKGADDVAQSKALGRIVTLAHPDTIADALRAAGLGDLTWPVVRDFVDEVITVSDLDTIEAMKMCYEILKIVIEPSAAVGLAAILSRQFQDNCQHSDCKNLGVVLSGGNFHLETEWTVQRMKAKQ